MARFFITGGAGFIGSHLVKQLTDAKHDVTVFDSFSPYILPLDETYLSSMSYRFNLLLPKAKTLRGSILSRDDLRRNILAERPDYIVHFAALPLASLAVHQSEEAFDSILRGTANLLEILRDVDFVRKFTFVSSSMVYGDFTRDPQPEDAPKDPTEIYGSFKLAGEIIVRAYSKRYGITHTIVRPSAVYGPTDNNKRVVQVFLENALRGKPLKVKNGRSTFLDFTYVEDTAAGIVRATLSPQADNDAFNITRGRARSLLEAAEIVQRLVPDAELQATEEPTYLPKRGTLDISKARARFGFNPQVDLEEGIERYLGYLRKSHG